MGLVVVVSEATPSPLMQSEPVASARGKNLAKLWTNIHCVLRY